MGVVSRFLSSSDSLTLQMKVVQASLSWYNPYSLEVEWGQHVLGLPHLLESAQGSGSRQVPDQPRCHLAVVVHHSGSHFSE